ncbi:unnamed protein product [Cylindrotheca closterium]|uniref:Response regulatory domain-containing protein n=1 Tax=Cylindrotheca closterium TaxID=2856 RepID=A0AAD2PXL8_9STRA|nr:unnamed protein product [Cylindrotheca closterium]
METSTEMDVNEETAPTASEANDSMDWMLTNYDAAASKPQSLEEELARLQILRSYLILDSEREFPFERLTALASRTFGTPIALVSLIDLGRQWFMSNRGLGDLRQTPRNLGFCTHAILSKNDLFIIPDASVDPRFMDNPFVAGEANIRFYAGAPLIAPEGYKLGTFCIIDTKTRPEGLDFESKQNLREMSAMAVDILVARRQKRERETEKNSQLIACSAHDLLTPLSGIELSLSLMKDDEALMEKLSEENKKGILQASKCSDILQQICRNVQTTFTETKSAFESAFSMSMPETVNIDDLVQKLYAILEPMPKKVPVEISVDSDVPKEILSDGSKIFRCAMNYLVVAATRTQTGMVKMTISVEKHDERKRASLVVKCEDTGPSIELDAYERLFKPVSSNLESYNDGDDEQVSLELALFSVACQMDVIGGEFGFRARQLGDSESNGLGSMFWFSTPFSLPLTKEEEAILLPRKMQKTKLTHADASRFHNAISSMLGGSSESAITKNQVVERQKRALVIEDSEMVRKMLVKALTKMGYDVIEAENGMAGLEELQNTLFDITLCDFLMPIMDGLDCIQQYRVWEKVDRPWFTQRIVGISAHATELDVERGRGIGMDDFLPKPITTQHLTDLLATDDQIAACKRLDTIATKALEEVQEQPIRKRRKTSMEPEFGVQRTCLILASSSTAMHTEMTEKAVQECNWQSTKAHSDDDAWTLLKMRTWNVVLVDDSFAGLIEEFRQWESKKRVTRQGNIVLMSENLDQTTSSKSFIAPDGIDRIIGKPVNREALQRMLDVCD